MLVSVIIPMYNAEKSLDNLYASLQCQGYDHLEIIFVDNNSQDHSYEKAYSFAVKDARVKVLKEPKQGVSYARKKGFHASHGECLYFIDSDDCVAPNAISYLVETAKETKADIVEGTYNTYANDYQLASIIRQHVRKIPYSTWQINHLEGISAPLWQHLYKKTCIRDDFFVPLNQFEDHLFNWHAFLNANKVIGISEPVYFYHISDDGLSSARYAIEPYQFMRYAVKLYQECIELGTIEQYETHLNRLILKQLLLLKLRISALYRGKEKSDYSIFRLKEMEWEISELTRFINSNEKIKCKKKEMK